MHDHQLPSVAEDLQSGVLPTIAPRNVKASQCWQRASETDSHQTDDAVELLVKQPKRKAAEVELTQAQKQVAAGVGSVTGQRTEV